MRTSGTDAASLPWDASYVACKQGNVLPAYELTTQERILFLVFLFLFPLLVLNFILLLRTRTKINLRNSWRLAKKKSKPNATRSPGSSPRTTWSSPVRSIYKISPRKNWLHRRRRPWPSYSSLHHVAELVSGIIYAATCCTTRAFFSSVIFHLSTVGSAHIGCRLLFIPFISVANSPTL